MEWKWFFEIRRGGSLSQYPENNRAERKNLDNGTNELAYSRASTSALPIIWNNKYCLSPFIVLSITWKWNYFLKFIINTHKCLSTIAFIKKLCNEIKYFRFILISTRYLGIIQQSLLWLNKAGTRNGICSVFVFLYYTNDSKS